MSLAERLADLRFRRAAGQAVTRADAARVAARAMADRDPAVRAAGRQILDELLACR